MSETILVKVTEEDIAASVAISDSDTRYVSCLDCPISQAVRRQLGKERGDVSTGRLYLNVDEHTYPLPRSAQRFIARYDSGNKAEPFTFKVRDEHD